MILCCELQPSPRLHLHVSVPRPRKMRPSCRARSVCDCECSSKSAIAPSQVELRQDSKRSPGLHAKREDLSLSEGIRIDHSLRLPITRRIARSLMPRRRKNKGTLTKLTRSELMARVGRKDTRPELRLRKALWARGLRYRLGVRLPGSPDIVFIGPQVAVFVDGCFWHGCPDHYRSPKTNTEFWDEKIRRNRDRDARVDCQLHQAGWAVVRVWSHEIHSNLDVAVGRILDALVARIPNHGPRSPGYERTGKKQEG
jgi:DNA mismatch endonuclease (patch repair protein)